MSPASNLCLRWFSRATWAGVLVNSCLALQALLAPDRFDAMLGLGPAEAMWVGNAGQLLVMLGLLSMPAARHPERYHVYAWMSVFARLTICGFWLWQNARWNLSGPIRGFFVLDGTLSLLLLVLLQSGLPIEQKLTGRNVARFLSELWETLLIRIRRSEPDHRPNAALIWFARTLWLGVLGNLLFAIPGLLFPRAFAAWVGSASTTGNFVWIGCSALLLTHVSLYMLLAVRDPVRFHVYAWLAITFRVLAGLYWLWQDLIFDLTGPLARGPVADAVLTIVQGLLLQRGLPQEYRLSPANCTRFLSDIGGYVASWFQTPLRTVALAACLTLAIWAAFTLWVILQP